MSDMIMAGQGAPPAMAWPRRLMATAADGNAGLAWLGLFMVLAMLPTALAALVDTRQIDSIAIWIKPLKFQASVGLHLLSTAWMACLLPLAVRHGRRMRGLAGIIIATALFEVAWIAFQAARGRASHFNADSALEAVMFTAMGVGALALVAASAVVGLLILRHGDGGHSDGRRLLVTGAGLGLLLGGVLAGITGMAIGGNGGHWVGGMADDAGGLPVFGWSRSGGDLRVAHFIGLHLTQALPLAALVLGRLLSPRPARAVLYGVAALGVLATVLALIQAQAGLPLWPAG